MNTFHPWKIRIDNLAKKIESTMAIDRYRLRQRLHDIEKKRRHEPWPERTLEQLEKKVDTAVQKWTLRSQNLPTPSYPLTLPINENRQEILRLIYDNQVIVICSETGSGKTTQLPKLCLELKRGSSGFIGMTQPRRIAARNLATYLSKDLGSKVGEKVGYKMRFADQVRDTSTIKIMTDGLLLAELQSDPLLLHYDTLIIDEAHERSLNIDFILGYLKKIINKRPDLKIIISSATLDHEKFSQHFGRAPVLVVPGKTYPVEVRYRPLQTDPDQENDDDLDMAIYSSIRMLNETANMGDILVFLPGEREIRELSIFLRKKLQNSHEILPVHARLASRDQDRIFSPGNLPRIILATNVAETSITVPGIRHVIDPGLAKIKRQDVRGSIQRLSLEKISRASADQRKGRCGRTGPGHCIRLYSEEDYETRPAFTDPEILRTSLAATILGMKAQGLGNLEQFPFMDPPSPPAVLEGWRLLTELGAVDTRGNLTPIGKNLARLPIDPRFGRMILAAHPLKCLDEILIIAAALSIPDPREWPTIKLEQAKEHHLRFEDKNSDFMVLLNIWRHVEQLRKTSPSKSQFKSTLKEEFISVGRVREWWEIYAQLKKITKEMGFESQPALEVKYGVLHKAILKGHIGMIGLKKYKNEYFGCRGSQFFIHPGSSLYKKSPTWIVAAELVETTRLYARVCARVEPEWIEDAAGPAVKKDYYEAYWDNKSGQVMVFQKVSYGGLPLIKDRKVHFGPIDPSESRRIFIQEALVNHRLQTKAAFLSHNLGIIREIKDKEHKARRRDLLIQEAELFSLYDRIIPKETYCARHFHSWYFHAIKQNPKLLHFEQNELLRQPEQESLQEQYPGHLINADQCFSLEYHFNPGAGEDGLSVHIPLAAIHQINPHVFEWLVPGMLPEKLTALLRALPKTWRKQLVPVPETVDLCLRHLDPRSGLPLCVSISKILKEHRGVDVPPLAWRDITLPDHLLINFVVIGDGNGKVLHQGRNLEEIVERFGSQAKKEFFSLPKADMEKKGLTRWSFDDLPKSIEIKTSGTTITGFPVIMDEGNSVALQILDDPDLAQRTMRRGLIRLFTLHLSQQVRQLRPSLKFSPGAVLVHLPTGKRQPLVDEVIDLIFDRVFIKDSLEQIGTREEFLRRLQEGQKHLMNEAGFIKTLMEEIHTEYRLIQLCMKTQNTNPGLKPIIPELQEQLNQLVFPGFLWEIPFSWLREYPRYLKAINKRMERRILAPLKDTQKAVSIKPFADILKSASPKAGDRNTDPEWEKFRWMVEEFRVSLFAQELGTSMPVSVKKLQEQCKKITY